MRIRHGLATQMSSAYVVYLSTWFLCYTVQTVAADLRRGEHIPKMQNNIGRKSMFCVLRQRGGKEAGGAECHAVPCRAGPRRAALGLALRSAQLP